MGMGMGGKGGGVQAQTIDPKQAIEQFQLAADTIEKKYPEALTFLQTAMTTGTQSAVKGMSDAKLAALPFSQTALDSTNELRMMLGMAPVDKAAGLGEQLRGISQFNRVPGLPIDNSIGNIISQFGTQMDAANKLTDPTQRQEALTSLKKEMNDIQYGIQQDLNSFQNISSGTQTKIDTSAKYYGYTGVHGDLGKTLRPDSLGALVEPGKPPKPVGGQNADKLAALQATTGMKLTPPTPAAPTYTDAQKQQATAAIESIEDVQNQLSKVAGQINTDYTVTPQKGYTGAEIQKKLEATPGYQFQFQQGQQALERQANAAGMGGSGNALIAATEYGQKFAANAYQTQIQNLANLSGMNIPFAQAQSQMAMQQGQMLAGRSDQYGFATQASGQDIAKARAGAYNQSGQAYFQAAQANAENQLKADMSNQQAQTAGMGQLIGLAGKFF